MKKYFKLTEKIAFYVPSTMEGSKQINTTQHNKRTEQIARLFCQWYGGASVVSSEGYYLMDTNELVKEQTNIVLAYATPQALRANKINLIKLASSLCKEWTQESIGLEIQNTFYLID